MRETFGRWEICCRPRVSEGRESMRMMLLRGMVRSPQHWSGFSPIWAARVRAEGFSEITQPTDLHLTASNPDSKRSWRRVHPSHLRESSHSMRTKRILSRACIPAYEHVAQRRQHDARSFCPYASAVRQALQSERMFVHKTYFPPRKLWYRKL